MEFAMALNSFRKKEKLPQFANKHVLLGNMLMTRRAARHPLGLAVRVARLPRAPSSILAEIISPPVLSIFMCTARSVGIRWKLRRRRFEQSAVSMPVAAPLRSCLQQRQHRSM